MRAFIRAWTLAALSALATPPEPAASVSLVLEEFDGPPSGQSVSIANALPHEFARDDASGTGAVGDTRSITVGVFATSGGSSLLEATANGGSSPGLLVVSQTPGIRSRTTVLYDGGGAGLGLDLSDIVSITLEGVRANQPVNFSVTTQAFLFYPDRGSVVSSGHSAGGTGDVTIDGSFFLGNLTNVLSLQLGVLLSDAGGRVEIERIVANFPDTCVNSLDDDGDGLVDVEEDPGCRSERDGSELSTSNCDDAIDNDGDGAIDWRGDGTGDPECVDPTDTREAAPNPTVDPPSSGGCGLGPELLGIVPALAWARRRRCAAHATA